MWPVSTLLVLLTPQAVSFGFDSWFGGHLALKFFQLVAGSKLRQF